MTLSLGARKNLPKTVARLGQTRQGSSRSQDGLWTDSRDLLSRQPIDAEVGRETADDNRRQDDSIATGPAGPSFRLGEGDRLRDVRTATDRLRRELTLIDRHSAELEKSDVEGILAFAERILPRAFNL